MFSNAPADAITHKPDSLAYPLSLLFSSYRVSLAEYNRVLRVLFPPVAGDRGMVDGFCVWKPAGGLSEDFLTLLTYSLFKIFTKCFCKGKDL